MLSRPTMLFTRRTIFSLAISFVLVIVCVAVYAPVRHHPFLNFDDPQYVTGNPHVQDGLSWDTVRWAFTSYDALNWHPVTWLSHALDVQMFGSAPGPEHVVNLLLHALNVLLLFLVLERATGYVGRSAMVAALFALHPINVESVAWIAERKNVLSMLFFLLALAAYTGYVRRPNAFRYLVVIFCFALGLMAKPQIITLPFVLLLWDYWPLERMTLDGNEKHPGTSESFWALIVEKLPLFALCAISAVLTINAQRAGGAVATFTKYPLSIRFENALVAYARYLGKACWPSHLALMYPHPGESLQLWQAFAALALLLLITKLVVDSGRRYLLVGWLWFVGTMVPMIGIVQVGHQAIADRYAYLPFIGVFIMACWGVPDLFWRLAAQHPRMSPRIQRTGLVAISSVVLASLALATHNQIHYWSDNLLLWSHTEAVIGPNLISEECMGNELIKRGEPDEAMRHYWRAVAIKPTDAESNFAIAVYDQKQQRLSEAIERYKVVVANATTPQMRSRALTYMSYAYRDLGDTERARQNLEAAATSQ